MLDYTKTEMSTHAADVWIDATFQHIENQRLITDGWI